MDTIIESENTINPFEIGDVVNATAENQHWYGYVTNKELDHGRLLIDAHYFFYYDKHHITVYININEPLPEDIHEEDIHEYHIVDMLFKDPGDVELVSSPKHTGSIILAGVGFELEVIEPSSAYFGKLVIVKKIISGLKYHGPDLLLCESSDEKRLILLLADMVRMPHSENQLTNIRVIADNRLEKIMEQINGLRACVTGMRNNFIALNVYGAVQKETIDNITGYLDKIDEIYQEDIRSHSTSTNSEIQSRLNRASIVYIKHYRRQYKRCLIGEITPEDLFVWKIMAKEKLTELEMGSITIEQFEREIQP